MFDPTLIQTYVYTVLCIIFGVQFKGSIDMIDIALKKVDNPLHTELNFLQESSFLFESSDPKQTARKSRC